MDAKLEEKEKMEVLNEMKGLEKEFVTEEYLILCEELTCSICLNILYDPIACKGCDNMFCSNCILEWKKYSNQCPNLCIYEPKSILFPVTNMLGKIKIKCLNYKKGCHSTFSYKDLRNHMESCEYSTYNCDCGFAGKKKDFQEHNISCKKGLEFKCDICSEVIRDENHYINCKQRKEKCHFCHLNIKVDSFKEHLVKECKGLHIMCQECYPVCIKLINGEESINTSKSSKLILC